MKARRQVESIVIDLEKFTITIKYLNQKRHLEVVFDKPARKFYFSVIAFIVTKMKEANSVKFFNVRKYTKDLKFFNCSLSGEGASKDDGSRLEKVRKAWRNRLPELRKPPLFKVVNRNSIKSHEDYEGYEYDCSDDEFNIWSSLFGYDDRKGKTWSYKFAVDNTLIAIDLKDVELLFKQETGLKAWDEFVDHLKAIKQPEIQEESFRPPRMAIKGAMIQFLADIESRFEHIILLHPNDCQKLKSQYVPIHVTIDKKNRHQVESSWGYDGYDIEEQGRNAYGFKGFDEGSEPSHNPWGEVKRRYNRIVVLADPGMGKTTLLKKEAWKQQVRKRMLFHKTGKRWKRFQSRSV